MRILRGPERDPEGIGDLLVREAPQLAEDDDVGVALGQPAHEVDDAGSHLDPDRGALGVRRRRG